MGIFLTFDTIALTWNSLYLPYRSFDKTFLHGKNKKVVLKKKKMQFAKSLNHTSLNMTHSLILFSLLYCFVTIHICVSLVTKTINIYNWLSSWMQHFYLHFFPCIEQVNENWQTSRFNMKESIPETQSSVSRSSQFMRCMLLHALAEPNLSSQIILHKFSRVISLFGKRSWKIAFLW